MEQIFRIENLTAGYGKPVISEASFGVNPGEVAGIIGRNGGGKTTLLRGIAGEAKRFSGKIYVKDRDITKIPVKQQAELISILPQKTYIPEGITVEEVLEMGCYASKGLFERISIQDRKRIRTAAGMFGIQELLYKECAKLSAGQQQMVLMCRMFVQDTPVMLLDEPNAALDYSNSHMFFSFLRRMVKEHKKAGILVIHDPEAALRWCDLLLVIGQGRILKKIDIRSAGKEELQQALQLLYPDIQVRENPFCQGYICYLENTR